MSRMGKRKKRSPHELIFFFQRGDRQKDIVNYGYSPATVSRYAKYYTDALKRFNEVDNKLMEQQAKENSKHLEVKVPVKNGEIIIKEKRRETKND